MRLTTRLSHARIKIKHSLLKLRLQQPLYYKTLAALVLMFAASGIVAAYFLFVKSNEPVSYADQFDLVIESYSLNAQVVSVDGDMLTVEGSIVETKEGVNTVKTVSKKVLINPQTAVYITILDGQEVTSKTGGLTDIMPGKSVTIYTPDDPVGASILNATKIEIIE